MANGFRSADTRQKIILGALIAKAGLRHADKSFLLGALLDIAKISAGSADYIRLVAVGQAIFADDAAQAAIRLAAHTEAKKTATSADTAADDQLDRLLIASGNAGLAKST